MCCASVARVAVLHTPLPPWSHSCLCPAASFPTRSTVCRTSTLLHTTLTTPLLPLQLSPAALLTRLNELGGANGIGRVDIVESRFVGMKSRGVYETPGELLRAFGTLLVGSCMRSTFGTSSPQHAPLTPLSANCSPSRCPAAEPHHHTTTPSPPGGTILLTAHRAMESITLDRGEAHLKDDLMPKYAELVYNGFWFSPEREALQALIDKTQEFVSGTVRWAALGLGLLLVRCNQPRPESRCSPYHLWPIQC
jgi:hypothetical protein